MKLTQEQIEQFNHDGFLRIKNFASPQLCDAILEKAKLHLLHKTAPIESEQEYMQRNEDKLTVRRLRQVYQREEIFRHWMHNDNIQPILNQLLKEQPVITLAHHNSIMTKMPYESSRTFWHQDRRYWHFENDNLISVWLCLDDEYLENGLLEFIPQSHTMSFDQEQFDEKSNFLDDHPQNKALISQRVHYNLHKGDIVLFHCKTLHHAGKNTTNKPKISFVYTVRGINNQPLKNTRSDAKEIMI